MANVSNPTIDPELLAIRRILKVLAPLSREQGQRVIEYALKRYQGAQFSTAGLQGTMVYYDNPAAQRVTGTNGSGSIG